MSGGIYYVSAQEDDDKLLSHGNMKCQVDLLDGSSESFILSKKACGQCLLDMVFDSINLMEKDFFGLQFQDSHNSSGYFSKWLNSAKSIKKQMPGSPPYRLQFKVRFYPNNPNQMQEEYTRYLLFLQIRRDIMDQKLYCDRETLVVLASYAVQSELGNYDPKKHHTGYISTLKFFHNQNPQFENDVNALHIDRKNLPQGDAESEYLTISSRLNCYGVEIFNSMTPEKDIVQIGPSSNGFNVFRNKERIDIFTWSTIFKISFKKKKICVQIKNKENSCDESSKPNPQTHTFILSSLPVCKTLWQNCVDYHTFFRVKNPPNSSQTSHSHNRCNLFNTSVTPSFGGRRTIPLIEDLQKRSRTTDRTFIRTPLRTRKASFLQQNSGLSAKPDVIGNSVVSYSSITLSSIKPNQTNKVVTVQNKSNHFQSQSSLEYAPKQATFDSDNSSVDENETFDNEKNDRLPDSGSFLISDHSIRGHHNSREKSVSSVSSSDFYRQRRSSPTNYQHFKRSSVLSDRNKLKIINKSIDESFDNYDRSMYSDMSSESLSELRLTSNEESLSTQSPNAHSRGPHITKFANNMNANNAKYDKSNGFSNTLTQKFDGNEKNGIINNDLEIKLRCDRNRRFGFTIKSTLDRGSPVIIESIEKNMPADTCFPRLNEGDQLLSINGDNVDQLCQDEIVLLIKRFSESGNGEIILNVRPSNYMADVTAELSDSDIPNNKKSSDRKVSMLSLNHEPRSWSSDLLKESIKIIEMSIDSNEILQQFESVYRKKPGLTMVEAKKVENNLKNRYRDISPYDQTRVILKSNSSSDYINASVINMKIGNKGLLNRYIAAQGPLPNTSADFWQMCWEQQTNLIVMLTALSEQGRPKCHKYWPPIYDTIEFGDFQISCLSEYHSEDGGFAIRNLIIYHLPSKSERKVQHMQYISWPDHGVPAVHYEFINFVDKVREFRSGHMEPIIVHCSAGIGRTGVLITMETAMCLIEAKQPIYPVEILQKMRDQRASMIQTAAQFKFVCEAIAKVYKDTEVSLL